MNTRRPSAFATQLFLASLAVVGTAGGLGFAVVDLRHDISLSANNTRLLEQRVAGTDRLSAELGGGIAAEQSPDILAQRNQSLALGLMPPAEAQVVRVSGSAERRLAAKRNAEIFASENGELLLPVRFNPGGAPR